MPNVQGMRPPPRVKVKRSWRVGTPMTRRAETGSGGSSSAPRWALGFSWKPKSAVACARGRDEQTSKQKRQNKPEKMSYLMLHYVVAISPRKYCCDNFIHRRTRERSDRDYKNPISAVVHFAQRVAHRWRPLRRPKYPNDVGPPFGAASGSLPI